MLVHGIVNVIAYFPFTSPYQPLLYPTYPDLSSGGIPDSGCFSRHLPIRQSNVVGWKKNTI